MVRLVTILVMGVYIGPFPLDSLQGESAVILGIYFTFPAWLIIKLCLIDLWVLYVRTLFVLMHIPVILLICVEVLGGLVVSKFGI